MLAGLITLAAITSGGTTPMPEGRRRNGHFPLSRVLLGQGTASIGAARIPPGLIEGTAVRVAQVEGAAQTFSYEGKGQRFESSWVRHSSNQHLIWSPLNAFRNGYDGAISWHCYISRTH
jgi:hypothetical protein